MRMPNGDLANLPDTKLTAYLLNSNHPEQPGHAILFRQLLGIGPENADVLRSALLRAAAQEDATPGNPTPYGQKYEIRFPMSGPSGTYTVLSVWIIEQGTEIPRLVTAFIE